MRKRKQLIICGPTYTLLTWLLIWTLKNLREAVTGGIYSKIVHKMFYSLCQAIRHIKRFVTKNATAAVLDVTNPAIEEKDQQNPTVLSELQKSCRIVVESFFSILCQSPPVHFKLTSWHACANFPELTQSQILKSVSHSSAIETLKPSQGCLEFEDGLPKD